MTRTVEIENGWQLGTVGTMAYDAETGATVWTPPSVRLGSSRRVHAVKTWQQTGVAASLLMPLCDTNVGMPGRRTETTDRADCPTCVELLHA